MRGFSQKQILQLVATKRYTVIQFDRATGKRLSTYDRVNPLTAFNEVARILPVLDRAVVVLPAELGFGSIMGLTLEQAVKAANEIRLQEFHWA